MTPASRNTGFTFVSLHNKSSRPYIARNEDKTVLLSLIACLCCLLFLLCEAYDQLIGSLTVKEKNKLTRWGLPTFDSLFNFTETEQAKWEKKMERLARSLNDDTIDPLNKLWMQLHPTPFASFIAALDAAQPVKLPWSPTDHCFALEQQPGFLSPYLLLDEWSGSRLFIRSCFSELANKVRKARKVYLKNKGQRGVLITGNSGIGKSIFLAYLIHYFRLLAKKPPASIIYDNLSYDSALLIPHGTDYTKITEVHSQSLTLGTWLNGEISKQVVYLVDVSAASQGRALRSCNAFTVAVASPHAVGKEVSTWLKHTGGPKLYVPIWTETELENCRRTIAPTPEDQDSLPGTPLPPIHPDSVKKAFTRYGGIPRIPFLREKTYSSKTRLKDAVVSCDLEVVGRQVTGSLDLLPEASSLILHYQINHRFRLEAIDFASEYVAERVYEESSIRSMNKVMQFVNETTHNPVWATARGNVFEKLAHRRLLEGGTFWVRKVNFVTKAEIGKPRPRVIHPNAPYGGGLSTDASITALSPGQYGKPTKSNFASIDSVLAPDSMFQMTTALSHHINIDGLITAVNALAASASQPSHFRFYFVVSEHEFADFTPGSFQSSRGTTAANLPANISISYFVLQLYPIAEELHALPPSPSPSPEASVPEPEEGEAAAIAAEEEAAGTQAAAEEQATAAAGAVPVRRKRKSTDITRRRDEQAKAAEGEEEENSRKKKKKKKKKKKEKNKREQEDPPAQEEDCDDEEEVEEEETDTHTCNCKGSCDSGICGCRAKRILCHSLCHRVLGSLSDRHKNCTNKGSSIASDRSDRERVWPVKQGPRVSGAHKVAGKGNDGFALLRVEGQRS